MWLFDGNARVQADAALGVVGPVTDGFFNLTIDSLANANITRGICLVSELLKRHMWLPATFCTSAASTIEADQGTYKIHSSKRLKRIDHVAFSAGSWEARPLSAKVLRDCEARNLGDDHTPCTLQFKCTSDGSHAQFRCIVARYNRSRSRLQPFAGDYAEAVESFPTTVYELEPTSHQFQLVGNFEGTLIQVCGAPVPIPRKNTSGQIQLLHRWSRELFVAL